MADPNDLRALLAQFDPTEQDRNEALRSGLLAFGFGMMGTPKGQTAERIGQAGLFGLGTYRDTLDNAQKGALARMRAAQMAMEIRDAQQKYAEQQELREAMKNVYAGGGPATTPAQIAKAGMPSLSPTLANAATLEARTAATPAPGQYERQNALADALEAQGRKSGSMAVLQQAAAIRKDAQQYAPKFKSIETQLDPATGELVQIQTYENREPTQTRYKPPPKVHWVDTGSEIIPVDENTRRPVGAAIPKSMSPADVASNKIALANLGISQQRLGLERERFGLEQTKEGQPTWDSTKGQFVYRPSAEAPTGRAVTPTGVTATEKALTEAQSNAVAYGIRAVDASSTMRKLEQSGLVDPTGKQMVIDATTWGKLPTNWLASPTGQQYLVSGRNLVAAILRKESGAQISDTEWDMGNRLYIPMPGDDARTVALKQHNAQLAIAGLRAAAGHGESKIDEALAKVGPFNVTSGATSPTRARADAIIGR